MKAVIMAGGEGRRLKSITGELPKPMAPLLGKPMLEHIIALLRDNGITDICCALKYNPAPIMDYFGGGEDFGVSIEYRIEATPLGTAGSVRSCADFYGGEDFLVISGDAACDFSLTELMRAHRATRPAATLALCRNQSPLRYGLAVTDSAGYVRAFIEKPDWPHVVTDAVNTGIYILTPRIMRYVPQNRPYDFAKDLFPLLLDLGEDVLGVPMEGYWCDAGTPKSYYQCCIDALEGRLRLPQGETPAPEEKALEEPPEPDGEELEIACRDRARLMRKLSDRLMDMNSDYSRGLTVRGQNFSVNFSPRAESCSLRVRAEAQDTETARELAVSAAELARALDLRL